MKCHNKSIRLDDRVYNYIINYSGDGFNQKFENIILDAMESERDRKEKIVELDQFINMRYEQIDNINHHLLRLRKVDLVVNNILESLVQLDEEVKSYVE